MYLYTIALIYLAPFVPLLKHPVTTSLQKAAQQNNYYIIQLNLKKDAQVVFVRADCPSSELHLYVWRCYPPSFSSPYNVVLFHNGNEMICDATVTVMSSIFETGTKVLPYQCGVCKIRVDDRCQHGLLQLGCDITLLEDKLLMDQKSDNEIDAPTLQADIDALQYKKKMKKLLFAAMQEIAAAKHQKRTVVINKSEEIGRLKSSLYGARQEVHQRDAHVLQLKQHNQQLTVSIQQAIQIEMQMQEKKSQTIISNLQHKISIMEAQLSDFCKIARNGQLAAADDDEKKEIMENADEIMDIPAAQEHFKILNGTQDDLHLAAMTETDLNKHLIITGNCNEKLKYAMDVVTRCIICWDNKATCKLFEENGNTCLCTKPKLCPSCAEDYLSKHVACPYCTAEGTWKSAHKYQNA